MGQADAPPESPGSGATQHDPSYAALDAVASPDASDRARAFLAAASEALAASLSEAETAETIARLAVPVLGDYSLIDLVDEQGVVRRVAGAHADPAREPLLRELLCHPPRLDSSLGVALALRTGEPAIYPSLSDGDFQELAANDAHLRAMHALGGRSSLIAPLVARGHTLGALLLTRMPARRPYAASDLPLAMDLARRAALAVDNARLYEAQRQARLLAEAAEARYRTLFEATGDAVLVADQDGHVLEANPAFCALLGYTSEEVIGLPRGLLTAQDAEWVDQQFKQLRAAGAWFGEIELQRKDGTFVPVEARVSTARLPTGPVFIGAMRDISERRAAQRLEHEFMAMVGHELKGPLTAVRGFAELMARTGSFSDRATSTIVRQSQRLERLVDELLDASRLATGRITLECSAVDLAELARAVVEQAQVLPDASVTELVVAERVSLCWGDRDRLEQVLQNLLSNAYKYAPVGIVRVLVDEFEGMPRVAVEDEGPGIPVDIASRLFERFTRSQATARTAPGLGLGLYIGRMLVEAHGGLIAASSRPEGGARFWFTVPPAPTPEDAPPTVKGETTES
ncbi:MAG: PAS domain S-box protein [Chloroflexi bacterium]|nr:PAS domain S-box protein [Chloroflexota bacterium]